MKKYLAILVGFWLNLVCVNDASAVCLCGCSIDCTPVGEGSQVDYFTDVATAIQTGSTDQLVTKVKGNLVTMLGLQDMVAHVGMKALNFADKILDKVAGKKVTSASRIIEESKDIDLNSEAAVQQAFIELFLQYPSNSSKTNQMYSKIGEQFRIDGTLEMYIIAREMEKEIDQKIKNLEQIETCVMEGKDCDAAGIDESANCAQSKDQLDELCLWRANLMIARIYDQIMWYNEFLLAMDAQYNAMMSIGTVVKIQDYEEEKKKGEEEKKKTSELISFPKVKTAESIIYFGAAFADEQWFEGTPEDMEIETEDGFDIIDRAAGFKSSLAGKQESFASMELLSEAQEAAQMAIRAHNVKSQLPSFKEVYVFYHNAQEYYDKVHQYLSISEKCIHNYLGHYYQNPLQAWVGSGCDVYEDKMYCKYSAEDADGLGMFDVNCPNNASARCYVTDITDSKKRSGLSGYLLALYDESKKQAASGEVEVYLSEDDTVKGNDVLSRNVLMREDVSREDRRNRKNNPLAAVAPANQKYAIKNPNDEDVMINEMRAADKLNWLSGALAAKAMVNDINGGERGKFGAVKKSFPLWNDQKEFYEQYINGKYENMKNYIATLPMSQLLIAAARSANEKITYPATQFLDSETGQYLSAKELEAKAIDKLEQKIGQMPPATDLVGEAVAEEKAYLSQLLQEHRQKVAEIKQQIINEGNRIEELNTIIDTNNREYNAQDYRMDFAEDTTPRNEEGIRIEQEMYDKRTKKEDGSNDTDENDEYQVDTDESPFADKFRENISENDENWADAAAEKEKLDVDEAAIEREVAVHKENIEQLRQKLNAEIKQHVKKYSEAVQEYRKKVEDAAGAESGFAAILSLIADVAEKTQAVDAGQGVVSCVRQKIIQKIDDAEQKLHSMQQSAEIYYAHNTPKIQKIHNDMIQSILDMGKSDAASSIGSCNSGLADDILADISAEMIVKAFMDMCADDYCTTPEPDDENMAVYFVSKKGKARDFRSPTGPLNFASAPLREIFHFDSIDFANIEKYYEENEEPVENRKLTITAEGFLNCGAEMPEVWQHILQNRPFVEREIDLEKLLNRGNPQLALARAGQFPCRIGTQKADASYNKKNLPYLFGYSEYKGSENIVEQQCVFLKNSDGRLIDTESDYAERFSEQDAAEKVADSSELGQILAYVPEYVPPMQQLLLQNQLLPVIEPPHKLSFNQAFLSAIHARDNFGDDWGAEAMEQYRYGERVLFTRNQFGDYLNFVEKQRNAAESLQEAKKQMEEIHQTLKELFNEFGDTISDDFDLADEDDYDLAAASIDGYKTAYMRQALEKLLDVRQMEIVQSLQDKADAVQHQIDLLLLDEDEMVELEGSEETEEVEYDIKQNTANRAISDAYDAQDEEARQRSLRQMLTPYCGVYAR